MFALQLSELLIPIMVLMIPIVAILAAHQRRMAEIVHQNARAHQDFGEIERLRKEVEELKELVHRQTILVDDARSGGPALGKGDGGGGEG